MNKEKEAVMERKEKKRFTPNAECLGKTRKLNEGVGG